MKRFMIASVFIASFFSAASQTAQRPAIHSHPVFRIGITGGYNYRIGRAAANAEKAYINEIRPGAEVNADASYFLNPSLTLGLKYAYSSSAGATYSSSVNIISNIQMHYIGPMLYTKLPIRSYRSKLLYGISVGYLKYIDDGWINHEKTLLKGSTIGALLEIAYDFRIYKGFFIGLNGGLNGGVLKKMSLNGVEKDLGDNKENLTRAYAGIGFRFIRD